MLSNESVVVSIGGKKVEIGSSSPMAGLPPEAAALLANMQHTRENSIESMLPPEAAALLHQISHPEEIKGKETTREKIPAEVSHLISDYQREQVRVQVSQTSPDLTPIIETLPHDIGCSLVRSRPPELEKAIQQQKALEEIANTSNPSKKYTIFETGVALGITLGKTTQKEAEEIMKEYSKTGNQEQGNMSMAFYPDITVTIFYNEDQIVREMVFGNKYKGETSKGLRSGDSVDKAIEIYGQPRMKAPRGVIWNKFGVFSQGGYVESIRIQF